MTIYDHSDIDFYEENFKNIYKELRPRFNVGDNVREISTDYKSCTITGIDEDNICYLIHLADAEEQIHEKCIIKFEDQHMFEKI